MSRPAAGVASSVTILAFLLALAGHEWRRLHIGLLVWGLTVTVVFAVWPIGVETLALRMIPDAPAPAKVKLHSRQRLLALEISTMGVGFAVLASGTGWTAVDVAYTAFFVVGAGASTAAGVVLARRRVGGSQQP